MFDHLLESSRWDDSNKWSNIGFDEEIGIIGIKIRSLIEALNYAHRQNGNEASYNITTWSYSITKASMRKLVEH